LSIIDLQDDYHLTFRPVNPYQYTNKSPEPTEPVLIIESGAEISCVGKGFHILFYTGETTSLGSAFTSATVIHDHCLSTTVILVINQATYIDDATQYESLLHTDQARHKNVIIHDLACCFTDHNGQHGKQSIQVDGHIIPLKHDGLKCFLTIREPNDSDWDHCHIIELTSPLSWTLT